MKNKSIDGITKFILQNNITMVISSRYLSFTCEDIIADVKRIIEKKYFIYVDDVEIEEAVNRTIQILHTNNVLVAEDQRFRLRR